MPGPLEGIDLSNPCLVWPRLQEAYYRRLAGETEVRVKFATQAGHQEEVEFGLVPIKEIEAALTKLKADCERRSGRRGNYALGSRFARRCF
jgi:hypothetical protein